MRSLRYFILGPFIVAMAFSLQSTAMTVLQIIAGDSWRYRYDRLQHWIFYARELMMR